MRMLNSPMMYLCFRGVEILLGWSLALQTVEFLRLQKDTSESGLWAWSIQRFDIPQTWIRYLLDGIYSTHFYRFHLWVRLFAAGWLLIHGGSLLLLIFLFIGQILILIRWRGAFNGGSDFMTLVALTGLLIAQSLSWLGAPQLGLKAALWYITIQSVTSYFMSGWVKTLRPEWRNGAAMTVFLNAAIYGPLSSRHVLRSPWVTLVASWAFILWEGLFPLALIHPVVALMFCSIATLFHFLVFWFFGLNRFFWAWLVTFPAIFWCSSQVLI